MCVIAWLPASKVNNNPWSHKEKDKLYLLTLTEFDRLPDGVTVHCINGASKVKGLDYIDNDTRAGMMAYGLLESQLTL